MPLYEAQCKKCGSNTTYVRKIAECLNTPDCCGEKMMKVILTAPVGIVEEIYYTSPIDGKPITTKQARIEDLRRNNARPWEGMEAETKVATQRKAAEEKAYDQAVETAVVSAYQSLGSEKQQALESAL